MDSQNSQSVEVAVSNREKMATNQDPSSEENMNKVLNEVLGKMILRWHEIRDDYGNVYRVFDKKEDGKWVGDIVNKRSRKRKEFRRSKKRLVWDILYRHYDKKNLQFRTKRSCKEILLTSKAETCKVVKV